MTHAPHGAASGTARQLPERAELLPGVWRLPLPLRDSPLGHVNTYLVRSDNGYLLVDCGWDTVDTLQALEGHLRALDIAQSHLAIAAAHLAASSPPLELFAEELRQAQEALSAITGAFTADDLLGEIFGRFCIGK